MKLPLLNNFALKTNTATLESKPFHSLLQEGAVHPFAGLLMFLAAYHAAEHALSEDYYGTDDSESDDISLGNTMAELAEQEFGVVFDEADPELPWGRFFNNATSDEISKMVLSAGIRTLIDAKWVPNEGPLFVVLVETISLTEFFEEPKSFANQIDIWDAANLSVDAGWTEAESATLSELKPFQCLKMYGDFYHTIIRVR